MRRHASPCFLCQAQGVHEASAACTTPCLTLAQSASSAVRSRRGKGSRVKLTGNKLNLSRAVTKGTRDISTVSHPRGWPRARNFHYNFSKGGRKGGKNVSQKPYQGPNAGRRATQPKICERLAFQGVKTQAVEPGRPFIWWEGSLKPLLFCTEVSKLHRSLKVSKPQRKEGRVKEINQKFLWDAQMPTWNRLSARIPSTLTTGRTFQNKSRGEVRFCYKRYTFGLKVTCAGIECGRKQVNKMSEEHCFGGPQTS